MDIDDVVRGYVVRCPETGKTFALGCENIFNPHVRRTVRPHQTATHSKRGLYHSEVKPFVINGTKVAAEQLDDLKAIDMYFIGHAFVPQFF